MLSANTVRDSHAPAVPKKVHLIGIGGINMSGLAKWLSHAGSRVTGSDATRSELTDELQKKGVSVSIGHVPENLLADTDLVIYSSAVPEDNPERAEARKKGIRQLTNFQFLGEVTVDRETVLICGTHGKSTATALTGLLFERAGYDPTVVVGSRVSAFPEGNVRFGQADLFVIEGDEYERHFLEFHPSAVVINNIELDHTDVFKDLPTLLEAFRKMLTQVRDGGLVIANADDPRVGTLLGEERSHLESRGVRIKTFGYGSHADIQIVDHTVRTGEQLFALRDEKGLVLRYTLHVPGKMNVYNATATIALTTSLGVQPDQVRAVLGTFHGIWRRFEKIAEQDNIIVISDYAHHPTAVTATLEAAKQWYPGRRIVACFQPHQRRRTRELFDHFVPAFDKADVVVMVEIYDVAGRENPEDKDVSSRRLLDAIYRHDAERSMSRQMEYVANPQEALTALTRIKLPQDVILIMGAGDIYKIATKIFQAR